MSFARGLGFQPERSSATAERHIFHDSDGLRKRLLILGRKYQGTTINLC
jgi:hypothetical protein